MKNWEKQLKKEFAIHFKDCPEEFAFLEQFIFGLLEDEKKKWQKEINSFANIVRIERQKILEEKKETCPYCGQYPHLDKCAFSGKPEAGDKDIFEDWEKELKKILHCPDLIGYGGKSLKNFIRQQIVKAKVEERQKCLEEIIKIPTGSFDSTPYIKEFIKKYEK